MVAAGIRPALSLPPVELVQGTHIVVPQRLGRGVYYVESPRDGRAVFVMPWHGRTLVGTTETPYRGDPELVRPLASEEEYLLEVLAHYFPAHATTTRDDIVERFAGLRVLPASTGRAFGRSREMLLSTDRRRRPRVISILGGKLTGWRAAAVAVLNRAAPSLPRRERIADTMLLPLRAP
jgi:glycerol-3-phosphate dehydrogenase